ncbi:MAG: BON domain-containing protein [Acidobacteriaceae bacterium]|nr:BON domain-containing protein [Acidobacteriaceae bacterium]
MAQTTASAASAIPDAQVEAGVLKVLAKAPDLANQSITTTTVYGVVTLSGTVETEAQRVEAETLASKTKGVQKVVDELTLGNENAVAPSGAAANPSSPEDANMAPAQSAEQAPVAQGSPESDNTEPANPAETQGYPAGTPGYGQGAPAYRQPPQGYSASTQPVYGGQEAGLAVTVPAGALLRMRINETLTSASAKPGDPFDGIIVNDVVAGGAVAIPRGAAVHGTVVSAKKSGALAGRGELTLQLTQVALAGKTYPLLSDVWGRNTGDKSVETVNKTAGGGAIGALFGAAAAGGKGAAIGAGVGAALGLGSAAASGNGQVFVPSEGLLTFHLAQPVTIMTVSQAEMDRLSQGVPQGARPQVIRRRYPAPYYGPYPYPY